MADLGKTDAQWTRHLGRELGSTMLAPLRELRELSDKFTRSREQMRIEHTFPTFADAGATVAGADPGNNMTAEGRVYVRLTGNAGARVVSWYSTTGGSGLVAQSVAAADGSSVTMVEQNSSGLSGTWKIPASGGNTAGDELSFLVFVDYGTRLKRVFTESDSVIDDKDSKAVMRELYAQAAAAIDAAKSALIAGLSRALLSNGSANPVAAGNEFVQGGETSLQTDTPDEDSSNNIVRVRGGLFEAYQAAMADETTGSAQSVVQRVPSASAGSFSGTGQGTLAAHTPGEACPASTWTFECVDDTIGSETFNVRVFFSKDGDERVETHSGLVVGKTWAGPHEFGPVSLVRTLAKTGDGSDLNLAAASGAAVTGETSGNTGAGTLHWRIDDNGSNWDISFYKSAAEATTGGTTGLVAKATNIATAAAFTASQQNSSGLSVVWTAGSAPVDTTTGTLALQTFKTSNANGVQDKFVVTVTIAAAPGLIQTTIAEEIAGSPSLNSAAVTSETIPDNYMKQGTFPPFEVLDN